MKSVRTLLITGFAVLVMAGAAFATVAWSKTFTATYKPKKDSDLAKAKCAVCHKEKTGKGGQNAYGKLLEKKKVDKDSLKAIEKLDADKDGISNIDEIKAGKLPGDPKNKPETK